MGRFHTTTIWLEDREIALLKKHNFSEEVWESEIDTDQRWVLSDLVTKGYLYAIVFGDKKYYQGTGHYKQLL